MTKILSLISICVILTISITADDLSSLQKQLEALSKANTESVKQQTKPVIKKNPPSTTVIPKVKHAKKTVKQTIEPQQAPRATRSKKDLKQTNMTYQKTQLLLKENQELKKKVKQLQQIIIKLNKQAKRAHKKHDESDPYASIRTNKNTSEHKLNW